MKRVKGLYPKIISDGNLTIAIQTVINSHKWIHYPDKPNKTALWLEQTIDERVKELRGLIEDGFTPSPVKKKQRYDANARKWREIAEPKLWPDQCVHHALIQILEPVMMRGMDHWCCGSIKGRGAHYGIRAMKKWMKSAKNGTRWCAELDIRHFYDSLKPEVVMARMRELVKDHRALDLIWRVIQDGIQIGAYYSQWFANTMLQPLDHLLRESGIGITHYIRYMDNFTIFSNRKRGIDRAICLVADWLKTRGLELKGNWQKFKVKSRMPRTDDRRARMRRRLPNALGYRFGRGFTLLRKHSLLRLKRQLARFYRLYESGKRISLKFAQGLLSRLGMLTHCNSVEMRRLYVKNKTQKRLKDVVRKYAKEAQGQWNMYLAMNPQAA